MSDNENQELPQESVEEKKQFLEPITSVTVAGAVWFAVQAALNAIIGWIAIRLFTPVWNYFFKKGDDESDQGVPSEDEGK